MQMKQLSQYPLCLWFVVAAADCVFRLRPVAGLTARPGGSAEAQPAGAWAWEDPLRGHGGGFLSSMISFLCCGPVLGVLRS